MKAIGQVMWTNSLTVCVCIWFIKTVLGADVHIYVSPTGSDLNNGNSTSQPLKTPQKAVDISKQYITSSEVNIELMAGYYDLDKTLMISRDNLHIRSYNKQEVHVTGGKTLPSTAFKPVTDPTIVSSLPAESRSHVRVVHLPDYGITDYGVNAKYGFWSYRVMPLEVFFNAQPLHIARWPNEGFINIVGVPDGQNGTRFQYNTSLPKTWHNESEPWVYGYWYWSWADRAVPVKAIDAEHMMVTLAEPALYGLRTGHWNEPDAAFTKQGGYFRFLNILSALDQPGEYYMDRQHGNLYVWLPSANGNVDPSDRVYVSLIEKCIQLHDRARDVTIEDLTIEVCRGDGVYGSNAHNVQLTKLEIRNTGSIAVNFVGDSRDNTISNCLIHNTNGGIFITGGNRQTLESSGNTVTNNEIFRFSRTGGVGYHGVSATGIGHQVRANHLYEGQYTAVWYQGNDITMEYNLLHHVCVNASDCGAFHTGRDWTTRGNIIRNNIVHHILRLVPGADVRGVMLDDQSSSTEITNNVFYDNDVHVNIGGGRDNIISNNVLYNAASFSIQVDSRGRGAEFNTDLYNRLHSVPYNSSIWLLRYPQLQNFTLNHPELPKGNQIFRNLIFNQAHKEFIHAYSRGDVKDSSLFNITLNGFSVGQSDHYNVGIGDYRIRCHADEWANSVGFPQVVSPNDVGPQSPVGPTYVHRGLTQMVTLTQANTGICSTNAPASSQPVPAYLPDGSRDNDMFNVTKQGCWLSVSACTNDPRAVGTYRDVYGEQHSHAADNETMCFNRAVVQWKYCGSHTNEQVAAIYGPSGSTTVTGDGCFMAFWGCPLHGGPADGHVLTQGQLYRDTYAEQHDGAAHNEEACLTRAHNQWVYCGSDRNHPITSIYRPTGAIRTAGAGCWIQTQNCPTHPERRSMFYDAWGATNFHTDDMEEACLYQAEYYWRQCGSNAMYPVTAFYRPSSAVKTYP